MPPYARGETASIHLQMRCPSKKLSNQVVSRKLRLEDFTPITTIGRGNMGTVFLVAVSAGSTNLPFAMKVMTKDTRRKQRLQRSQLEKEILSRLDHPFMPFLYAHFESDKHTYLITEFCSGGDLNVLRHKQPEKRFSEAAARFYGAEVLLALEYLHNLGIVYRDLKPENILIQENGHIMLTDFDLALELEPQFVSADTLQKEANITEQGNRNSMHFLSLYACVMPWATDLNSKDCDVGKEATIWEVKTVKRAGAISPMQQESNTAKRPNKDISSKGETHSFVGTEEYVAPEILRGTHHGFPVDWWTFGVFLYELVYGTTPFKTPRRKETFLKILTQEPDLPGPSSPLKDLIRKLLAKDPTERLGSSGGAEELKRHRFFEGVKWEKLEEVFRPPFVPPPFSLKEYDEKMTSRTKETKNREGREQPCRGNRAMYHEIK